MIDGVIVPLAVALVAFVAFQEIGHGKRALPVSPLGCRADEPATVTVPMSRQRRGVIDRTPR